MGDCGGLAPATAAVIVGKLAIVSEKGFVKPRITILHDVPAANIVVAASKEISVN